MLYAAAQLQPIPYNCGAQRALLPIAVGAININELMSINDVCESATIFPRPCKLSFDLLTLKVVSRSRVTWTTCVPIVDFPGLSVVKLFPMYAKDRQTDVRQHHRLMPPLREAGIIIVGYVAIVSIRRSKDSQMAVFHTAAVCMSSDPALTLKVLVSR